MAAIYPKKTAPFNTTQKRENEKSSADLSPGKFKLAKLEESG